MLPSVKSLVRNHVDTHNDTATNTLTPTAQYGWTRCEESGYGLRYDYYAEAGTGHNICRYRVFLKHYSVQGEL